MPGCETGRGIDVNIFIKGLNPCEGRKLNIQHYRDYLASRGCRVVDAVEQADVVLLWSCGFREDYKRHSLEIIAGLQAQGKRVIVAGCLPGIDPERLAEAFAGEVVLWADEQGGLDRCLGPGAALEEVPRRLAVERLVVDLAAFRKSNPQGEASFLDQFIKLFISQGCGCDCTYCSEKRTFPAYRSFPLPELLTQCREVMERTDFWDVMLQADSAGEYGRDIGSSLPELIDALLALDPRVRVGIQGLHPAFVLRYFEPLQRFWRSGRALHVRIPIQSASDEVLRRMNRGYTRDELERIFSTLDGMGFRDYSTDLIVGFPGEREEDFQQSLDFVTVHIPTYVNLSRFMESPTIPASQLDGKVAEPVKQERIQRAIALFQPLGVFCNADDGEHARDRQRRIGNELGTEIRNDNQDCR